MSISTDLFDALGPLVSDRVYPVTFAQPSGLPTWPAIRYTFISADPIADVCGDGGSATADVRVQLDLVAETRAAGEALQAQVETAMAAFTPPALWAGFSEGYDEPTKTYRRQLDYLIYPSSVA